MAFNLQMPNNVKIKHKSWKDKSFLRSCRTHGAFSAAQKHNIAKEKSMYDIVQKIGFITPSLCFQSDVFYPNAIAAVNDTSFEDVPLATGCRGNQIFRDFPLEPRVPVAVPLVQYPTLTSGIFLDEVDICALPVLNWENYIKICKRTIGRTRFIEKKRKPLVQPLTEKERLKKKIQRWERKYANVPDDERPNPKDISTSSSDNDSLISGDGSTGDEEIHAEEEEDNGQKPRSSTDSRNSIKPKKKESVRRSKRVTLKQISSKLFHNPENLELTISERRNQTKKQKFEKLIQGQEEIIEPKKGKRKPKINLGFLKDQTAAYNSKRRNPIALSQLHVIKNIPHFKFESTWNYAFGGAAGACCCIRNKHDENMEIFVGNKTKLRRVVVEKSVPNSMLSYKLQSVWDEDLATDPVSRRPEKENPLSNVVLQILPLQKLNMVGVRRGKSVDLYSTAEDSPYLLDSIPNICYGSRDYDGWKKKPGFDSIPDPLMLGLDFNPQYSTEFVTIDENMQIRICDFTKGITVSTYQLPKSSRKLCKLPEFPNFRNVNDASGVSFGHHGQLFLAWEASRVVLGDRRDHSHSRATLIDIFDLRRSVSSWSWSDQIYFSDSKIELNEYISSLRLSCKENYYYVGTTSRVFMMDIRVPGQPVIKLEHGMRSAAAYLDTYMNESYEVLVAGSQRFPTTFCAILDHDHVACFDRPDCHARNPVLHSLPRHLPSSRNFFDEACTAGFGFSWEPDHQRAKSHNMAWTTGITITKGLNDKNARNPPGILVFSSNCYGDLFYQEWEQPPIEPHRKTEIQGPKFTQYLKQWESSMKSKTMTEFLKPSLNPLKPIDYSLLLEPSARNIPRMAKVRLKPFDALEPNEIVHRYVEETQKTFEVRMQEMRKYKSDMAQRALDFWEHESDEEDENVASAIKQERLDQEFLERYGNEWNEDGTRDVEFIPHTLLTPQQELVELENQISRDLVIDGKIPGPHDDSASSSDEELPNFSSESEPEYNESQHSDETESADDQRSDISEASVSKGTSPIEDVAHELTSSTSEHNIEAENELDSRDAEEMEIVCKVETAEMTEVSSELYPEISTGYEIYDYGSMTYQEPLSGDMFQEDNEDYLPPSQSDSQPSTSKKSRAGF